MIPSPGLNALRQPPAPTAASASPPELSRITLMLEFVWQCACRCSVRVSSCILNASSGMQRLTVNPNSNGPLLLLCGVCFCLAPTCRSDSVFQETVVLGFPLSQCSRGLSRSNHGTWSENACWFPNSFFVPLLIIALD